MHINFSMKWYSFEKVFLVVICLFCKVIAHTAVSLDGEVVETLEDVNSSKIKELAREALSQIDVVTYDFHTYKRTINKIIEAKTRKLLDTLLILTMEVCERRRKGPDYKEIELFNCLSCQAKLYQYAAKLPDIEEDYRLLWHNCWP